jgi:transposase
VVKVPGHRQKLSAVAAIVRHPSGRLLERFRVQRKNFTADSLLWFVLDLWRRSGRKLTVVWDNLGAHWKVARALGDLGVPGLRFVWLPPYCPDLNPVESLWSSTKWGSLGNHVAKDLKGLWERVSELLSQRSRRQRFLASLFRQSGLTP